MDRIKLTMKKLLEIVTNYDICHRLKTLFTAIESMALTVVIFESFGMNEYDYHRIQSEQD